MPRFAVTQELIVHCRIQVVVEADTREKADALVTELVPQRLIVEGSSNSWSALVAVVPPEDIELVGRGPNGGASAKAVFLDTASTPHNAKPFAHVRKLPERKDETS